MDKLRASVLKLARHARDHLSDDEWLKLARLCQVQRYDLNKLIDGAHEVNPVTYMRIAAGLEQVGFKTRLSELDSDTHTVVMDLGGTVLGEIKDYFPKEWDRQHFTQYICNDVAYSSHMEEKVKLCAEELKRASKISDKPKVNIDDVQYLRFRLHTADGNSAQPQRSKSVQHSLPASVSPEEGAIAATEERFKVYASDLTVLAQAYLNMKEADRDRLRKVVGQDNIFNLKNLLSRLCGSKAFGNR